MAKTNLLNLNRAALREFFADIGEKPFRADQVMKWIYQQGVSDFNEMSNLNKNLRAKLLENAEVGKSEASGRRRRGALGARSRARGGGRSKL